jgi:hypothetical protein
VQQQLVLQRSQPLPLAQLLAEAKEPSQPVTEVREPLEIGLAEAPPPDI